MNDFSNFRVIELWNHSSTKGNCSSRSTEWKISSTTLCAVRGYSFAMYSPISFRRLLANGDNEFSSAEMTTQFLLYFFMRNAFTGTKLATGNSNILQHSVAVIIGNISRNRFENYLF